MAYGTRNIDSLGPVLRGKSIDTGYQVGNLGDLDRRYLCTKCDLLLRDPMQGDCGHRYCKNCVQLAHTEAQSRGQEYLCKVCEEENSTFVISPDRTYPDNALKREITKTLNVQCPNSPCKFMGLIADVLEHAGSECEFKPQRCNLCNQDVPAALLASGQHKSKDCPRRPVPCSDCKLEVPADCLDEHRARDCIGVTKKCDYCLARVRDNEAAKDTHLLRECKVGWHANKACPYGCVTEVPEDGSFDFEKHRESQQATHLDLVMALHLKAHGLQQHSIAPAILQQRSLASYSHRILSQITVAPEAATEADHRNLDYDKLQSLKEKMVKMEQRLMKHPASLESKKSRDEQQTKARELLAQLQAAVSQGDKVEEVLGAIRKQLESCCEEMRQHEVNLQKSSERMVDFERKRQEIIKALDYQDKRIRDLELRADLLENGGFNGILVWRIVDVRHKMEEARDEKPPFLVSPQFYTSKTGYRMCSRIYLNGNGSGKHTHISVYFCIMRGEYDNLLWWPFAPTVTITLIDQNFSKNAAYRLKPDPRSPSFSQKPSGMMNTPNGFAKFVKLTDFERFIVNDTVFIKFVVDLEMIDAHGRPIF